MKALITGVGGQDGSLLAEFLLAKNYRVFGVVRRNPETCPNLKGLLDKVEFIYGDLRDAESLMVAISRADPDEVYNLGGQTFVPPSWVYPEETFDVNTGGLARILFIVEKLNPRIKVYQASSSEMFGNASGPLDETSPMNPTSPYGVSKLAAHHLVQAYRGKGLKVVSGLCFNHESPRRGTEMVTMKIARHVARFACGIREPLELGCTDTWRDWGAAEDFVEAMWMMTQKADTDYVVGTGRAHSVEGFLFMALNAAGVNGEEFLSKYLKIEPRFQRQGEINSLLANTTKIKRELGWEPTTRFTQVVERMVKSEMSKLEAIRA